MKARTVGWLAAAAMTITSLAVWFVTPSGGFGERLRTRALRVNMPALTVHTEGNTAWRFIAGDTLRVEGRLGRPTLPAGQDSETYLYLNVNEAIMTAIAVESNGRHYFVEDEASLPAIFNQS